METTQIAQTFAQSDFAVQLNQVFADMPDELKGQLHEAHDRYLHLIGAMTGDVPADTVAQDQADFAHMTIKVGTPPRPLFCDDDCATFMAARYNLPVLLCRMHVANDFNWIVASGVVKDSMAMEDNHYELAKCLKDNAALAEVVQFLIDRELLSNTPLPTAN